MLLYAFTIALSAFLLFLVQPIIARQILPWFGGSAAVWTTCMMFFQVALLAGYGYSDLLARRLAPRMQRIVHGLLLLGSLAFLPILAGDHWRPEGPELPVARILLLLCAVIGLPYFMLSTTGPLLQAWFAGRYPQARVYRLYALSNAASLVALVTYPLLIEAWAPVKTQAGAWSVGYGLFVLAGLSLIGLSQRAESLSPVPSQAPAARTPSPLPAGAVSMGSGASASQQLTWFVFPAVSSVLLLSVTAHLTRNVAAVPFLWLLPLVLYLLSFVLCFDGRGWYRRGLYLPLAGVFAALMALGLFGHIGPGGAVVFGHMPLSQGLVVYGTGLFALCMFLHGELAERRPPVPALTRFYLMLAFGGAAGGVFVAVFASILFDSYLELPLSLLAAAAVALFAARTERTRFLAFAVGSVTLVAVTLILIYSSRGAFESERNFYGVLSVRQVIDSQGGPARLRLSHGDTLHGEQLIDSEMRRLPTSYYGPDSGVGRSIGWIQANLQETSNRVGVIGLGVGTLATYGRAGDLYRFYELDPAVPDFARRHFTFLADTAARTEVVLGDGRLALEREPANLFDLLVVDAFSGDAIPMHLLTAEAMLVYVRHLAPGGAVAFHLSNRYLDLEPVVANLAASVNWRATAVRHVPGPESSWTTTSLWVVVSANHRLTDALEAGGGLPAITDARVAPWTDGYGNLLSVVRFLR